jgi:hypothetical protein
MHNRSASIVLKETIQLLEVEHAFQGKIIREELYLTYDRFKPVNILRDTFKNVATSPHLLDYVLGATVGLLTGYLSKKIVIGTSGNLIRKFLGFMTQLGVTNSVAQHPDMIKSIGQFIYQYFLRKKRKNYYYRD